MEEFTCEFCDKVYRNRSSLLRHIKSKHASRVHEDTRRAYEPSRVHEDEDTSRVREDATPVHEDVSRVEPTPCTETTERLNKLLNHEVEEDTSRVYEDDEVSNETEEEESNDEAIAQQADFISMLLVQVAGAIEQVVNTYGEHKNNTFRLSGLKDRMSDSAEMIEFNTTEILKKHPVIAAASGKILIPECLLGFTVIKNITSSIVRVEPQCVVEDTSRVYEDEEDEDDEDLVFGNEA